MELLRVVLGRDRKLERRLEAADERTVERVGRLLVKGYPAEELRERVLKAVGAPGGE
jgi:hypothetical protein